MFKRIMPLLVLLLMLGGCASFARKDIGYGLPNGFRASQSLPYQLIVKRFADERPMLKRSYRNLGDGSDADLSA